MNKISAFSVNYPITILMLVLGIILLGVISFQKLGMDLFPDLNNPRLFVEIQSGELPPEEMESKFVENIESVAIRQSNVVQVSSISRVGWAQVTVEYSWDADMDEAFLDLQKSLTTFSQNLEIDDLTITQNDPNATPVMLLKFAQPQIQDMDELRKIAANYLRNEIIRLEGIAAVDIIGAEEKEVVIETDPYILEAYGLSLSNLSSAIQSYNRDATAGSIEEMGKKYIIKGIGEFETIDDIGNIIVSQKTINTANNPELTDKTQILLKDVAKIRFENKEPLNIVRVNQERCLALAVYKEMKYNTVSAVNELQKSLVELRKALPGYELSIIRNQSEFITTAIDEVEQSAVIGIILAVIILFVFLRRIGTTLIISIAIPISIIATFNLMYFNGLTLNIMTLGGLALGAGMLVDNAIVVMENIFRNLESGMKLRDAAIEGTAQVGGAITASTITTIIVFLPIVYLHGASGELFKEQAWTVAFSLLSSLVVAILVIPMLSNRFLKLKMDSGAANKSITFPGYGKFLEKVLAKRWQVIAGAFLLIVISILFLPVIGSEFIPRTDASEFRVELKLEEGTALSKTDQVTASVEQIIQELIGSDVATVYSQIGPVNSNLLSSGTVFEDENYSVIYVSMKPESRKKTDASIAILKKALTEIPEVEVIFSKEVSALQTILGTEESPVVVEVQGEDLDELVVLSDKVGAAMKNIPELINVETGFSGGRRQVNITVDRVRAGINNVSVESIGSQLQDYLQGRTAGDWESEGELRDITVKVTEPQLEELADLRISNGDQEIRLDDLAFINYTEAQKEIFRRNQVRIGRITAQISGDIPLDKVATKINKSLQNIEFPANYSYQITGEELKRSESFGNLKFALILSVVLIYMVLAAQFESLLHPFTILLTIPLALVGAILIFLFLGIPLNIMAYIGIIMLLGIAVNDSIILVDAINKLRQEGLELIPAIIEAGKRRIRPILMTSLTTILALLPLTIGFGEGASLRSPMALAVIGGLVSSTVLTLIVIPCFYYVLDRLRFKS
jgi:HAE1 family hydrophobic/amphiphilic exporter-1